ncbi:MAG: NPCBM/NEW2 domain-containing protein [Planctomycetia bacterium]|nr:NPCBM/NEW2 domain-containing protein [Planctomycetia bacterium]
MTEGDGKIKAGTLTELGSGQLGLGMPDPAQFKTRNLVLLNFKERTSTLGPNDPLVVLSGGDRLALIPESIDDEALTGRWARAPARQAIRVPLESVRGIIFDRPSHAAGFSRLLDLLLDGGESHDTVVLGNGDVLQGEFGGLNEKELTLSTPAGRSSIDRQGLRAVIFNPTLTNSEPLRGEGALVSLTDGSRFRARDLKFAPRDQLSLRPQFGGELSIPLSDVASVRFLEGCATYLSDLPPADYKFEPFFDVEWPLRRDRSVAGGYLKLRGAEFPKGLGVHSRSAVTYRLDGKFRRLHAIVGIDDSASGKGSAIFEVLLDGKVAYRSDVLTGASPAAKIDILNLAGAKTLTLRVDFAGDGDIQDHADWCDALVVK